MRKPDPIATSDLPADVQDLIRLVLKRSRLWKSERAALTLELLAHFQDGLDAGRSAEDLIKTFGDPKTTAKLMRRAKKRNRPLWWKAGVFATKAFAAFVGLHIGSALLLSLREPNIATDYVAKLNAPLQAIPASDRGLPLYLEAWKSPIFRDKEQPDILARPGDPNWSKVHDFLVSNARVLQTLRDAASHPAMGFQAKSRGDFTEAEDQAFALKPKGVAACSPTQNAKATPLFAVLLPHLSALCHSANLLSSDMLDAAATNDATRVTADYNAMRQMAAHAREFPFLVNQLVSISIVSLADERLAEINVSYPSVLAGRRVALIHQMSADTYLYAFDLSGERMGFNDVIQRVYSDDGQGDGRITVEGMEFMTGSGALEYQGLLDLHADPSLAKTARIAALPAVTAFMASRAELMSSSNHFYDLAVSDSHLPAWERRTKAQLDKETVAFKADSVRSARYLPLTLMLPSLSRAMDAMDASRAQHEALMVALALDVYRDKVGHYPATLAELVPQYLPAVPLDLSTGQPLRYKLVKDKPLLYGLGWDGKDDGGVWTDTKTRFPKIPDTGDWVLYPPPAEQ